MGTPAGEGPCTSFVSWGGSSALAGVGVYHQAGFVYRFEVGAGEGVHCMEQLVVPALVGGAAYVPGRAVVGYEHAVVFHGLEDDADLWVVTGDVYAGF